MRTSLPAFALALALPAALVAAPAAAQDGGSDGVETERTLESLADTLSDPRTQGEIAATVAVLSEVLLDLPLAPLLEPLAEAGADIADVPRKPVDPDLTLRRMSPGAGDIAARLPAELPRAMDRMAGMSEGFAAMIPALKDAVRRIADALPQDALRD